MRNSRRNYYRILHLQPGAPPEVLKAAYRALMQTLRMHPDLGGDHEQAAIVNEAYGVLSDPVTRAAYDLKMLPAVRRARGITAAPDSHAAQAKAGEPMAGRPHADRAPPANACSFCYVPLPQRVQQDTRCARCKSPLAHPLRVAPGRELFGRRSATRANKDHAVNVQLTWRGTVMRAWLRDISLTGMRLLMTMAPGPQQCVRVFDPDFEALVAVVKSRHVQANFVVHAQLLSMLPKRSSGIFLRTAA